MSLIEPFESGPPAGWPSEAGISPWRLVPLRQASADLDISEGTLRKALTEHGLEVVNITRRKASVLASDLVRLIKLRSGPARNGRGR